MQVKAYKDGLVYHEVNVTVPQGGRADRRHHAARPTRRRPDAGCLQS